jgi:hypothetical protein
VGFLFSKDNAAHMRKFFYFLILLLLLLTLSCGSGGGSSSGGGGSSSGGGGSGWPSGDYNYLYRYNASLNNGIIIRWQTPILVNTNGIPGAEDSFRQWGSLFSFVNYNPSEGIIVNIGNPGAGLCGITSGGRYYRSNGRMISANITIRSDLRNCVNTITHEACHAIGFWNGHTADGGLMDPNGGNGQITTPVRNMINLLYALPLGTDITPMLSAKRPSLMPKLEYKQIPDGGGIGTLAPIPIQ